MSRLSQYTAIWISVVVVILYFVAYYSMGFLYSKFSADFAALIGLAFMSASTTPVAYRAFMNGIRTDRDRFIFSYWFVWTLALGHRCWAITLGLMKSEYSALYDLWYFSPISGLFAVGFALAAGFGGAAPFSNEMPIPRREMLIFGIAAGFSGIIAGIAIGVFTVAGWTF